MTNINGVGSFGKLTRQLGIENKITEKDVEEILAECSADGVITRDELQLNFGDALGENLTDAEIDALLSSVDQEWERFLTDTNGSQNTSDNTSAVTNPPETVTTQPTANTQAPTSTTPEQQTPPTTTNAPSSSYTAPVFVANTTESSEELRQKRSADIAKIGELRALKANNPEINAAKETVETTKLAYDEALAKVAEDPQFTVIQQIQTQKQEIETQIDEQNTLKADLESKVSTAESTVSNLKGSLNSLNKPNKSDFEKRNDKDGSVSYPGYDAALAKYVNEKQQLEEKIREQEDLISNLTQEILATEDEIERLEGENSALDLQLQETLTNQEIQKGSALEELQNALTAYTEAQNNLKSVEQTVNAEIDANIEQLEENIAAYDEAIAVKEKEEANAQIPLIDPNDPNADVKLFEVLGVQYLNGEAYIPDDNDTNHRRYILDNFTTSPEDAYAQANELIQDINTIREYSNDPDFIELVGIYGGVYHTFSDVPDIANLGNTTMTQSEIINLNTYIIPNLQDYKEDKALVASLYALEVVSQTEESENISYLNNLFFHTPKDGDGENELFGFNPLTFNTNLNGDMNRNGQEGNIGITAEIYNTYDQLGYDCEFVYDESGRNITQVIITDENNNTKTVNFNENGSFNVMQGDDVLITSEEIALRDLNNNGESIHEDITGNTRLTEEIRDAYSVEEAFESVVDFCHGDRETARKIFNGMYKEDSIYIDESFNFMTVSIAEDGTETTREMQNTEQNPIYSQDTTVVTDRLYTYRSQDRVINSDILQQFNVINVSNTTINGMEYELPSDGSEYYINGDGRLCRYEYEFDYSNGVSITSRTYDEISDTVLYEEVATTYIAEDGTTRTKVTRTDANGELIAEFDETDKEYQKRVLVERNYALAPSQEDDSNLTTINMTTEEIDKVYMLMQQDNIYSDIITDFGLELNSQGAFDHLYDWIKDICGSDNTAKAITQEIIQRTEMTPILNMFLQGDEEAALLETEEEFERRIENAESLDEIYNLSLYYYGDEDIAFEITRAYVEQNQDKIQYTSSTQYLNMEYTLDRDEETGEIILNVAGNWSAQGHGGRETSQLNINETNIKIEKGTKIEDIKLDSTTKEAMELASPNDFESLYFFWTDGGIYSPETIQEYEDASVLFTEYNITIGSAETLEAELANAESPQEAYQIFLTQCGGDEEKATEVFNIYYANFFSDENYRNQFNPVVRYDIANSEHTVIQGTTETNNSTTPNHWEEFSVSSFEARIVDGEVQFVATVTNGSEIIEMDANDELTTSIFIDVNKTIDEENLYQQVCSSKFMDSYIEQNPDVEMNFDPEKSDFENFTNYVVGNYTNTYTNLYGDSEIAELVSSYTEDMDTYASKITAVIQIGSIGLSFVCPAFGMVAMSAGFIDNTIDLVNMTTNKQYDNYGDWLLNTSFEVGCLAGGVMLGKFANYVGGKATYAVLQKTHSIPMAHIAGTTTEVFFDVVTGIGFDFITSGGENWNLGGNAFSGFLDVISGIRGYSAITSGRGQLRLGTESFSPDGKTVTMLDAGYNEVTLECIGYDTQGNLIYGNKNGQMLAFGSSNGIDTSNLASVAIMANMASNPELAQTIYNAGVRYNPQKGQYEVPDATGKYQPIEIKSYQDIMPQRLGDEVIPNELFLENGTLKRYNAGSITQEQMNGILAVAQINPEFQSLPPELQTKMLTQLCDEASKLSIARTPEEIDEVINAFSNPNYIEALSINYRAGNLEQISIGDKGNLFDWYTPRILELFDQGILKNITYQTDDGSKIFTKAVLNNTQKAQEYFASIGIDINEISTLSGDALTTKLETVLNDEGGIRYYRDQGYLQEHVYVNERGKTSYFYTLTPEGYNYLSKELGYSDEVIALNQYKYDSSLLNTVSGSATESVALARAKSKIETIGITPDEVKVAYELSKALAKATGQTLPDGMELFRITTGTYEPSNIKLPDGETLETKLNKIANKNMTLEELNKLINEGNVEYSSNRPISTSLSASYLSSNWMGDNSGLQDVSSSSSFLWIFHTADTNGVPTEPIACRAASQFEITLQPEQTAMISKIEWNDEYNCWQIHAVMN